MILTKNKTSLLPILSPLNRSFEIPSLGSNAGGLGSDFRGKIEKEMKGKGGQRAPEQRGKRRD